MELLIFSIGAIITWKIFLVQNSLKTKTILFNNPLVTSEDEDQHSKLRTGKGQLPFKLLEQLQLLVMFQLLQLLPNLLLLQLLQLVPLQLLHHPNFFQEREIQLVLLQDLHYLCLSPRVQDFRPQCVVVGW